jgi:hypothetical protein
MTTRYMRGRLCAWSPGDGIDGSRYVAFPQSLVDAFSAENAWEETQ